MIKNRTMAFYERVLKPFELCKKRDINWEERALEGLFYKSRSCSDWMFYFLKNIDKAETEITLHKRVPKSFVDEVKVLCNSVHNDLKTEAANRGR
ncbi:MAG: hypothetical protein LBI04_04275 [Treponema sp.]|nr:hypothetical protein [Treponema sp.]